MESAQFAERVGGVFNRYADSVSVHLHLRPDITDPIAAKDDSADALVQHIPDEPVTIVHISVNGHKRITGRDGAGIDANGIEAVIVNARHEFSVGGVEYVFYRPGHDP
jgi:hypothetical protein